MKLGLGHPGVAVETHHLCRDGTPLQQLLVEYIASRPCPRQDTGISGSSATPSAVSSPAELCCPRTLKAHDIGLVQVSLFIPNITTMKVQVLPVIASCLAGVDAAAIGGGATFGLGSLFGGFLGGGIGVNGNNLDVQSLQVTLRNIAGTLQDAANPIRKNFFGFGFEYPAPLTVAQLASDLYDVQTAVYSAQVLLNRVANPQVPTTAQGPICTLVANVLNAENALVTKINSNVATGTSAIAKDVYLPNFGKRGPGQHLLPPSEPRQHCPRFARPHHKWLRQDPASVSQPWRRPAAASASKHFRHPESFAAFFDSWSVTVSAYSRAEHLGPAAAAVLHSFPTASLTAFDFPAQHLAAAGVASVAFSSQPIAAANLAAFNLLAQYFTAAYLTSIAVAAQHFGSSSLCTPLAPAGFSAFGFSTFAEPLAPPSFSTLAESLAAAGLSAFSFSTSGFSTFAEPLAATRFPSLTIAAQPLVESFAGPYAALNLAAFRPRCLELQPFGTTGLASVNLGPTDVYFQHSYPYLVYQYSYQSADSADTSILGGCFLENQAPPKLKARTS
ncbi:uncharacterized protein B0I36DRAFT_345501 [Microdochium trichocladiopsis]|uniref:Uncharacterized protein n=1 Tax=Microdochium trichocladiopsis TaxID=1682393 RepID=A0A9P8YEE8_9PEZI|nr:uncharacterized protein B0I36DRAFT_345501 [Microdochium trichocladiopsis]KAH7037372.1 hypothetical protein B0I36DRAFT_345501 [Microdochium trichocladiopsis]